MKRASFFSAIGLVFSAHAEPLTWGEILRQTAMQPAFSLTCRIDVNGQLIDRNFWVDERNNQVDGATATFTSTEIRWQGKSDVMLVVNRSTGRIAVFAGPHPAGGDCFKTPGRQF